ncbi:MAG: glycosyltransferase family 9 protein [Rhodospirillales bacterium]|nr:glycosyltransferase family 9 protein [Rhodospirillales bacterium]MSP79811.1 glycosyltransferase family 9 protein [Rhodospirillales bacterium]
MTAGGDTASGDGLGRELPPESFRVSPFWRLAPSGMRRRWRIFHFFDWIARHFPVDGEKRGLLVVRMDGIGDMVLFRAALDHYAEAFRLPASEITVLGCDSWREIAPRLFQGFRVVTIDEHRFARRPLYRFKTSLMVRRLNARTVAVDSFFRRALMADALAYVSGASEVVMSVPYVSEKTRAEYRYYLSLADRVIDTGAYPDHEIVRHFRFVSTVAGRAITPTPPRIEWRAEALPRPLEKGTYVLFNAGANEPGRRWPTASYVALARALKEKGNVCVFVGFRTAPADDPAFARLLAEPDMVDWRGQTGLARILDLMAGARLVVSNDSGPAHLSIALGRPTVVFVGGGHFGCFVPYPEALSPANARFLFARLDCYHCFWNCTRKVERGASFPCVAEIPVSAALAAAEELLGAGQEGRA